MLVWYDGSGSMSLDFHVCQAITYWQWFPQSSFYELLDVDPLNSLIKRKLSAFWQIAVRLILDKWNNENDNLLIRLYKDFCIQKSNFYTADEVVYTCLNRDDQMRRRMRGVVRGNACRDS